MATFSSSSKERLKTCHPKIQMIMKEVVKHIDCAIVCGFRGREAQDEAYRIGTSLVQFPKSKHNVYPSRAVDTGPWVIGKGIPWDDVIAFAYLAGWIMKTANEMNIKLIWGGNWRSKSFFDGGHFELDDSEE